MPEFLPLEQRKAPVGKFRVTIMQEREKVERDINGIGEAIDYVQQFQDLWSFRVYDEHGDIVHQSKNPY